MFPAGGGGIGDAPLRESVGGQQIAVFILHLRARDAIPSCDCGIHDERQRWDQHQQQRSLARQRDHPALKKADRVFRNNPQHQENRHQQTDGDRYPGREVVDRMRGHV